MLDIKEEVGGGGGGGTEVVKQTDRQKDRLMDRHVVNTETDRQEDRTTGIQVVKQTDRQADRQTTGQDDGHTGS